MFNSNRFNSPQRSYEIRTGLVKYNILSLKRFGRKKPQHRIAYGGLNIKWKPD